MYPDTFTQCLLVRFSFPLLLIQPTPSEISGVMVAKQEAKGSLQSNSLLYTLLNIITVEYAIKDYTVCVDYGDLYDPGISTVIIINVCCVITVACK